MAAADTIYAALFAGPELLERGRDNRCTCPVARAGATVTPSAGTFTALDGSGLAVVSGAVSVVGGVATFVVLASALADRSLAEDWSIEWSLAMPDGVFHTFRRSAALCRRRLYPSISDSDLIARHSDLGELRPSSQASYQGQIDAAWEELLSFLRQQGSLPHRIISAEELRLPHLFGTLALIFTDFMLTAGGEARWAALAEKYGRDAFHARQRITVKFQLEDSAGSSATMSGRGSTFLCDETVGWQWR
jgi:hypothetical protein